MFKWLGALFCVLLLVGCAKNIDLAQDAYNTGEYRQTIEILTDYLDKKGSLPDNEDADRIFMLMSNVVEHYKLMAENKAASYQTRIEGYDGLLFIRQKISYKFYEPHVYALTQRFNTTDLSKQLGQLYYLWAKSIEGNEKENYRYRTELLRKGLNYYESKELLELYAVNNKQYSTMQASDLYQAGQKAISQNDFKMAAESFLGAADVYKEYGRYKDSQALGLLYDKRYRKDESNRLYHQASANSVRAKTHADYREVADIFHQSYTIYEKYGQVNDAKVQYDKYYQKGLVKIYIIADHDIINTIKNEFKADYIKIVTSGAESDITLALQLEGKYYRDRDIVRTRSMSENVLVGKEPLTNVNGETVMRDIYRMAYFTQTTTESRNLYKITGSLNVSGQLNLIGYYDIEETSNVINVTYSGNIPNNSQYRPYKEGRLESEYSLKSRARDKIALELKSDLANIGSRLKNL